MTSLNFSDPVYHNDEAARKHLEAVRWPNGVTCPMCGSADQARPLAGKSMGAGWFYCGACKDKFTVRTGTVYERSHIPLHKWMLGFRLYAASKKGFSAHQLHRSLGITYKSAWFMAMRIREAMAPTDSGPIGGKDKTVEVDETFHGPADYVFVNEKGWQKKTGAYAKPHKIVTLVERGGRARSFKVENIDAPTLKAILSRVDPESILNTDQALHYKPLGKGFAKHESVNHSAREYARGKTTTNTVEGFFSIFKRGMAGVYQHCDEKYLQRYLSEFDFRYSHRVAMGVDDSERTTLVIKGAEGKRLTYRPSRKTRAA